MIKLNRYVMYKIMYTILLLISTLSFCQETDIEISKSEVFKNLLNVHKNASEEKHNIDYYSCECISLPMNMTKKMYVMIKPLIKPT